VIQTDDMESEVTRVFGGGKVNCGNQFGVVNKRLVRATLWAIV
jgi:hypothetical protein